MTDAQANPNLLPLSIKNLSFSYDTEPLLDLAEFEVAAQQRVAIIGPSGCGKTTLMHLIAGLIKPNAGSIRINYQEITTLSEPDMDRLRGREIGIVFQRLHLMPAISVLDNLLLAQKLARVPTDKAHATLMLEKLGVADFKDVLPNNLSQGQAQRAAIARSIIHKPSLVIADEPTSALDSQNASEAIQLLSELSDSVGFGLLVVTHDERVRSSMDRVLDLGGKA